MTTSSFYTDGDPNTGVEVAGPSSSAFYVDSDAAANSAAQAAASAAQAAASAAAAVQSAAGTATPLVDGTAAVGVSTKWAHEDHVHPTDTSRAAVTYVDAQVATKADAAATTAALALKAPLASPTFTGSITASAKGHLLGSASGTVATGTVTLADANILLYNNSSTSWAGIGADLNGAMWFKTGSSGTPVPAMYISTAQVVNFTNSPIAPTPSTGDNSTKVATTAYVDAKVGTATPLINGTAAVGTSVKWAHEDHVHPTDTSRAPTASPTFTGSITAAAKGHLLGTAGGTLATGSVTLADANILLYNNSSTNWAGVGTDTNGAMWFKTGVSGTPAPAMYISNAQVVNFTNSPIAPTPSVGDNSTKIATTAWVQTNVPPATAAPLVDAASAAVGTATKYAREDHVHPVDNTAWTSASPTVTASAGTFTTVSCTLHYKVAGKICFFWAAVTITNAGTASGDILFTLPFTPSAAGVQAGGGKETNSAGYQLNWQNVGSVMHIAKYDNTTIIATGRVCNISGTMELA